MSDRHACFVPISPLCDSLVLSFIDAEAGNSDEDFDDAQELAELEEAERQEGAGFIDSESQDEDDIALSNLNARILFGEDDQEQEHLHDLADQQRREAGGSDGRPHLAFSEAAVVRMQSNANNEPTDDEIEAGWGNAGRPQEDPGAGRNIPWSSNVPARPGPHVTFPNWDPADRRITEVRCRAGNRGILVGDPENVITCFSGYISAIGDNSDVSPTIINGIERLAYAKNEKGHPVVIDLAGSLERGTKMRHLHVQLIFSAHVPATARGKELMAFVVKECLGINQGFNTDLKVMIKFFMPGQKAKEMFG